MKIILVKFLLMDTRRSHEIHHIDGNSHNNVNLMFIHYINTETTNVKWN